MPIYALDGQAPELPGDGTYWIAPDAHVIGRVRLGVDVGVWFGSILRGDNEWLSIGARTNVQESTVMHTDMGCPLDIGEGCTIGHRVTLHGCTIGEASLVGMGATILNNARIGKHCLVGAGSLVTEGKEFPDGALIVGSPARVLRMLEPEAIAKIAKTAEGYVRNWRRFATGLKRLDP